MFNPVSDNIKNSWPGYPRLILNVTWLAVVPIGLWAIAAFYVPIFGSFLDSTGTLLLTIFIVVLIIVSLIIHVFGHIYAAKLLGASPPATIAVFLFGDAAQRWVPSISPWREAAIALSGPAINGVLAVIFYLIWNMQINALVNLAVLFACGFNVWLSVLNLTPAFPMDGGRLLHAIQQGLLKRKTADSRIGVRFGILIALALIGWGIILIVQQARFS